MEQEVVLVAARQRVDQRRVAQRAERRRNDGLRLATGKHGRAVSFRQHTHFDLDRADSAQVATVDAWLAVQHAMTHDVAFDFAERFFHCLRIELAVAFAGQRFHSVALQLADAGIALLFVGDAIRLTETGVREGLHCSVQRHVLLRCLPVPARFTGFRHQCVDGVDDDLHLLVSEQHTTEHLVFGEFFRFRLDHQHGRARTRHDHQQVGTFEFFAGWVQQVLAVTIANTRCGNRTLERHTGNCQCSRCTDQCRDICLVGLVDRHHRADHLGFIRETFGEQRANGAINQTRVQRLLLAWPTFTTEEPAGNLACCVGFFLVVDRQRKEVEAGLGPLLGNHRAKHNRIVHRHQHCAGGLARNAPCFKHYFVLAVHKFLSDWYQVFVLRTLNIRNRRKRQPVSGADPSVRSTLNSGSGRCGADSRAAIDAG